MSHFEIVAHRGIPKEVPENTLLAYQLAIDLGADAVEMDVRLTADRVPVIYHYFYLEEMTPLVGPIFKYTAEELMQVRVANKARPGITEPIPTLREVMESIGGKIGLEIELKGPERECADIVAGVLQDYQQFWDMIEVTSYEPALLLGIHEFCPGLATDLLYPRSEPWMKPDVIAYQAFHRTRLARARAVHLHPTQLTADVISFIRSYGIEIHAWDVNNEESLQTSEQYKIPRLCTDQFQLAFDFRNKIS
ncbi:MAG TPA: glycerophosphodiester phosphodiesterase [Anaerolineales bacterium]